MLLWVFDGWAGILVVAYLLSSFSAMALLVYQLYLLTTTGQTLGKKWLSIRVVSIDTGQNGGFVPNVIVRVFLNSLLAIGVLYLLIDLLFIFRRDRRCIHDLIADTKVIRC